MRLLLLIISLISFQSIGQIDIYQHFLDIREVYDSEKRAAAKVKSVTIYEVNFLGMQKKKEPVLSSDYDTRGRLIAKYSQRNANDSILKTMDLGYDNVFAQKETRFVNYSSEGDTSSYGKNTIIGDIEYGIVVMMPKSRIDSTVRLVTHDDYGYLKTDSMFYNDRFYTAMIYNYEYNENNKPKKISFCKAVRKHADCYERFYSYENSAMVEYFYQNGPGANDTSVVSHRVEFQKDSVISRYRNLIREKHSGEVFYDYDVQYDWVGNPIRVRTVNGAQTNPKFKEGESTVEYDYDDFGNIIMEKQKVKGEHKLISRNWRKKYVYEYY